jgi:hypothetical protein
MLWDLELIKLITYSLHACIHKYIFKLLNIKLCYTEIDITGEMLPPREREENYAGRDARDREVYTKLPFAVRNFNWTTTRTCKLQESSC